MGGRERRGDEKEGGIDGRKEERGGRERRGGGKEGKEGKRNKKY